MLKKLLLLLALAVGACAMPIEPATDSDPQGEEAEVERIDQASWCFGFPYKLMAFPVNQGIWQGSGAGQIMTTYPNSACQPVGTEFGYVQDDGKINLLVTTGYAANTCTTWKNSTSAGIICGGGAQSFPCPAQACLTEPVTWQLEPSAPNNATNWGWSQWSSPASFQSAAPGNHGIWPKVPTQCSSGVPTAQVNPSGSGSTLTCHYPMPSYWLKQN